MIHWDEMDEDEKLEALAVQIAKSFEERDPYFRELWLSRLMKAKWERATMLQSGIGFKANERSLGVTYIMLCEADASHGDLLRSFRQVGRAYQEYVHARGLEDVGVVSEKKLYRGQSRAHLEFDAFYLKIADLDLAVYLAGRPEFAKRWRKPEELTLWEEV